MLGHQYPWVRALWTKDLPPVWLPHIPSCNSSNKGSTRDVHTVDMALNEKACTISAPQITNNEEPFYVSFLPRPPSLDCNPCFKKVTKRSIQLGSTWIPCTPTKGFFTRLELAMSSTITTRGKFDPRDIAIIAKEFAWEFCPLRICFRVKLLKWTQTCLTLTRYPACVHPKPQTFH